ncbi:MAG TPA: hypothetical protein VG146_12490 [Verrucomicrobiae bacterium]|nr:hypothetical protein [Verrucomicrobiae bacterium]
MGATLILVPVVIAAWPAFSAAVVAAAASLGYHVASEAAHQARAPAAAKSSGVVNLAIDRSEVVTNQLGRDQRLSVTREGVTVTFSRDARGKASLCVTGQGQDHDALKALGEELGHAVVQEYVYRKITDEMRARGFVVVEEERTQERAIHLKVRHWEG